MSITRRKLGFLSVAAVALGALAIPASAQTNCTATASPEPIVVRSQGNTEQVADLVFTCTGGTPTPVNMPVPQVNITVFLNSTLTSQVTQPSVTQYPVDFSEALLLVDEPNKPQAPAILAPPPNHPVLNCGNLGAADNGVSGPGVCGIISDGTPAHTYDGTRNVGGNPAVISPPALSCTVTPADTIVPDSVTLGVYGCGRPNVFQARLATGGSGNAVVFLGVPFDPPAPGSVRTFRITNVRVNAAALGAAFPAIPVQANLTVSGSAAVTFGPSHSSNVQVVLAFVTNGLLAHTAGGSVVIQEGFATAWKSRNIATVLSNSMFSAGRHVYVSPDANYPVQAAQNVPGGAVVLYNTEDGWQWQNNSPNGPPSPDPPPGYGTTGTTSSVSYPLFSSPAYHPLLAGYSTNITAAGVSEAGTRLALVFYAPGETVTVPNVVYLHSLFSPSTITGVMVLTQGLDPFGAGPFVPAAGSTTTNSNGLASPPAVGEFIYEVLFANQYDVETASVHLTISGGAEALVYTTYAPFYTDPNAGFATPTAAHPAPVAIPRFAWDGTLLFVKPTPPTIGAFRTNGD